MQKDWGNSGRVLMARQVPAVTVSSNIIPLIKGWSGLNEALQAEKPFYFIFCSTHGVKRIKKRQKYYG